MSEIRQALADAANTVDGITAHPYYVQGTEPGHTFVRLDLLTYPDQWGEVQRWNVVVLLGQDQADAEKYLEDKLPALRAALGEHLYLTEARPQQLVIQGVGVLPCVFITGQIKE